MNLDAPWKICPACCGEGVIETIHPNWGRASCPTPWRDISCEVCGGIGQIPDDGDDEDDVAAA